MESELISGRIGTRIVGALELVSGICLFGLWIRMMVINSNKFLQSSTFFVILILFGIYFMAGIVGSFLLVYATYSHANLKVRKGFSIAWVFYGVASFVGAIILLCTTRWFEHSEWFLVMIGLIIKWVAFICIVCTYIWGLSEAIEEIKKTATVTSSAISFNSKMAQQKMQWRRVEETQNYGAFAAKKQFC